MPEELREIDFGACPYCGQPLIHGKIYGAGEWVTFWMPIKYTLGDIEGFGLSIKKIKSCGGFVLGKPSNIGLIQKAPPDSYYCKACNLLITKP